VAGSDDHHVLAQLLHLFQAVAGEDDRLAPVAQREEGVLKQFRVDRVQTAEGFVQQGKFGTVDQSRENLDLLLVPLAQLVEAAALAIGDVEALEARVDGDRGLSGFHAVEAGEEQQLLSHLHLGVEPALFRHVTEAAALSLPYGRAPPPDGPFVGPQDIQHHAHRRGLSRTVRTEKAEDDALRNGEAEVAHRYDSIERFRDRVNLKHNRPPAAGGSPVSDGAQACPRSL
jgi:hypothetical protein